MLIDCSVQVKSFTSSPWSHSTVRTHRAGCSAVHAGDKMRDRSTIDRQHMEPLLVPCVAFKNHWIISQSCQEIHNLTSLTGRFEVISRTTHHQHSPCAPRFMQFCDLLISCTFFPPKPIITSPSCQQIVGVLTVRSHLFTVNFAAYSITVRLGLHLEQKGFGFIWFNYMHVCCTFSCSVSKKNNNSVSMSYTHTWQEQWCVIPRLCFNPSVFTSNFLCLSNPTNEASSRTFH